MRELAKSVISFSWSMSLFGVNQVLNLMKPQGRDQARTHPVTTAFNATAEATEAQLSGALRGVYKVGDQFQREMVDMMSSTLTLDSFNPGKMLKVTSDIIGQVIPGKGGASKVQYEPIGWGPVPPAEEA